MLDHFFESFQSGLLAELFVNTDTSTENSLNTSGKIAEYTPATNGYTADYLSDSEIL